jgi:hypothetical protein
VAREHDPSLEDLLARVDDETIATATSHCHAEQPMFQCTTNPIAEYERTDVGPMILLRSTQIVHFGSGSGDEWDIDIAA